MSTLVRKYRGFDIMQDVDGFYYERWGIKHRRNSAWSCIVSIDEELSP